MTEYSKMPMETHLEFLLACYRKGVFPMAQSRASRDTLLVEPRRRGIVPLDPFHAPRRLLRSMRASTLRISHDQAFSAVIAACAAPAPGREETWINANIEESYTALHRHGFAHSIECWRGTSLVGGLYGVALGAVFFGESMFSLETHASKIALVALAARLRAGGYVLLDAQFWTAHLAQFQAQEISRAAFRTKLANALSLEADFHRLPGALTPAQLAQEITQTS